MGTTGRTPARTLVSCILPTKNRAAFIPAAIACYHAQTHSQKELIILDNGDDHTGDLIPLDPSIHYRRVEGEKTTGEMRNLCVGHAQGEFICHFDSDDWSAPERVTDQVTRLGDFGVVTGYHSMLFYDVRDGRCYRWSTPKHPLYVLGTSLCYRKDWWVHHPFEALHVSEDMRFWQQAMREARRLVTSAPAERLMVARVHNAQTSYKNLTKTSYQPVPQIALPGAFPCALM